MDYEILGIMNIMCVSVTERTREIGLRMSIGARGVDILSQFLIEAVITSVSGGMIGILVGLIASWLVNFVAHWPVYVQLYSVVLSFAVCTVTGAFFSDGIRPRKPQDSILSRRSVTNDESLVRTHSLPVTIA